MSWGFNTLASAQYNDPIHNIRIDFWSFPSPRNQKSLGARNITIPPEIDYTKNVEYTQVDSRHTFIWN